MLNNFVQIRLSLNVKNQQIKKGKEKHSLSQELKAGRNSNLLPFNEVLRTNTDDLVVGLVDGHQAHALIQDFHHEVDHPFGWIRAAILLVATGTLGHRLI